MKRNAEKKLSLSSDQGFTIVEMVVVISIFAVLAGVTLFSFSSFTNNITLENVAQDVAIRVVEAQRFATSGYVSTFDTVNSHADYRPNYGVYFDNTSATDQFTLFIDRPESNDNLYNGGGNCGGTGVECRNLTQFQGGYGIERICINQVKQPNNCTGTSLMTNGYVSFERPYLDAKLYQTSNPTIYYNDMEIELYSPKGLSMTVVIHSTGQVEVRQGRVDQVYPVAVN